MNTFLGMASWKKDSIQILWSDCPTNDVPACDNVLFICFLFLFFVSVFGRDFYETLTLTWEREFM